MKLCQDLLSVLHKKILLGFFFLGGGGGFYDLSKVVGGFGGFGRKILLGSFWFVA